MQAEMGAPEPNEGSFKVVTPSECEEPLIVAWGREVLVSEAEALSRLAKTLGPAFVRAVDMLLACRGHVVVTGVGKSGHIGRKLAATFASIGTPAFFMHAGEAMHGDLGQISQADVVLALSHSGESSEIVRLLPHAKKLACGLIGITAREQSALGTQADVCLLLEPTEEACPLNLAPTVSTTLMLGLGDALAMTLFRHRNDPSETYRSRHPGGVLGRHLKRVAEVMRTGDRLPLLASKASLGEALWVMTETPGRPGAVVVISPKGTLVGLFTDGDLRRLLEQHAYRKDAPIEEVMHTGVRTVTPQCAIRDAVEKMKAHHVDQLVVVCATGRPVGLLDVQDVLDLPL